MFTSSISERRVRHTFLRMTKEPIPIATNLCASCTGLSLTNVAPYIMYKELRRGNTSVRAQKAEFSGTELARGLACTLIICGSCMQVYLRKVHIYTIPPCNKFV